MVLGRILGGLVLHQAGVHVFQLQERGEIFRIAEQVAAERGKPLLVVGRPKQRWNNPCSPDGVTLDLDPAVLQDCPLTGLVADVRDIPLPTGSMGAAAVFHVLEHVPSLDDLQMAWRELWRVADEVFVAYPRKSGIWNWLIVDHHCWVTPQGIDLVVEERRWPWRIAIVEPDGSALIRKSGEALV